VHAKSPRRGASLLYVWTLLLKSDCVLLNDCVLPTLNVTIMETSWSCTCAAAIGIVMVNLY